MKLSFQELIVLRLTHSETHVESFVRLICSFENVNPLIKQKQRSSGNVEQAWSGGTFGQMASLI